MSRLLIGIFLLATSVSSKDLSAETINMVSLVPGEGQLRNKFLATEKRLEEGWVGTADVVLLIDGQVGSEESMSATVRRGRNQVSMLRG